MYLSDIVEWTLTLVVAIMMSISEPPTPKEEPTPAQPVQQEEQVELK